MDAPPRIAMRAGIRCKTYKGAIEYCEAKSFRVPTKEEAKAPQKKVSHTGCGFDDHLVWTTSSDN